MKGFGETLFKLFKFGVVGCSGLAVDFSITWLLKEKAHLNRYVSSSCGFSAAVINNYLLNRAWTFHSRQDWRPEFTRFFIFSVVGLALSNLFIFFFHEKRHMRFYYAKALSVVCVFLWNFFANYFFNF